MDKEKEESKRDKILNLIAEFEKAKDTTRMLGIARKIREAAEERGKARNHGNALDHNVESTF